MAINTLYLPPTFSPAFNTIAFVVESGNNTKCEFQYIADIYEGTTLIARLKTFPDADGNGVFKVQGVLQSILDYTLRTSISGFQPLTNHFIKYTIKFGEEYDLSVDCDAGVTVYENLLTTSSYYAWMGAFNHKEFSQYDSSDFLLNGSSKRFLTDMPTSVFVKDYQELAYLNQDAITAQYIKVITYDSTGTPIQTCTITNALSNTYRVQSVGVGPENLNGSTLSSGSQPVITDSVKYYTVQLFNSSNTAISETFTFTIDRRCTKFGGRTLKFLNRKGAWDLAYFTAKESDNISISNRKQYNKLAGEYTTGSPTGTFGYLSSDGGKKTYSVDASESKTLVSNWLTEEESFWIKQLATSPEVYMIDDDGDEVPVNVTNSSYEPTYKRNQKMIQATISISMAHSENIQRI